MKCLVHTKTLKRRLAAAATVVPRLPSRPVLETVRLEVDGRGRGTLTATDLETWVQIRVPVRSVARAGAVQLPRRQLWPILRQARESELWLDADPEAFDLVCAAGAPSLRLVVSGSRTRVTLRTHRPEDYPVRDEPAVPGHHELELRRLRRLIRTTVFAADKGDNPRYALGGCWFGLGEGAIDVVGTDGHRLAHASCCDVRVVGAPAPPATHAPGDRSRALAPVIGARALRVLDGLLEELNGPFSPVQLAWTDDGSLLVRAEGLTFSAQQLIGTFPDWGGAFPPPSPHRAHLGRSDALLAFLEQAKAPADRGRPATRLTLRPGMLTLAVEAADPCAFEAACDCQTGPTSADFDPAQLVDVLGALGGEAVDLELGGPDVPAVLHAAGLRYCVMPLDPDDPPAGGSLAGEGERDTSDDPASVA